MSEQWQPRGRFTLTYGAGAHIIAALYSELQVVYGHLCLHTESQVWS